MQASNTLDLILALLTPIAPTLVLALYRKRKTILRLLQAVSDYLRKGQDAAEADEADIAEAQAAYANYMAYAGQIDKRVDLVAQMQARSDAGAVRLENMMIGMEAKLTNVIQETGERLRVRLDSQLLNDSRLHRQQNERLDGHDTDIVDLKRRMDIADDYLHALRSDLDDCLKKGA